MKVSKEMLRRIVREACGDPMEPMEALVEPISVQPVAPSPCPHATAAGLKNSGIDSEDILGWIHTLLQQIVVGNDHMMESRSRLDELFPPRQGETIEPITQLFLKDLVELAEQSIYEASALKGMTPADLLRLAADYSEGKR